MSETAPTPLTLRSFWHDLPREGQLLLSIVVFEFLGTGLVLPFLVVYLHEIRGFSLSDVGLLIGLGPLIGFLVVGPGGAAIDAYGARRVILGATVLMIAGDVALAFAQTLPVAALAVSLQGIAWGRLAGVAEPDRGGGAVRAPTSLLRRQLHPAQPRHRDRRHRRRAVRRRARPRHVPGDLPRRRGQLPADPLPAAVPAPPPGRPARPRRGRAAGDRVLPPGATAPCRGDGGAARFVSAYVGYAQLNAGTQAFARDVGQVSTQGLGFAYACNTLVIVLLQLVVLRRIDGHRRTRVIMVMSMIWAIAWLTLGASGLLPGTLGATVLVAACTSIFALGETLMQPTIPPLVNDLAPDHLRGRTTP